MPWNQITEAAEKMYLEELRDPITNTVLANVPFILSHLITNYGETDPNTVIEKELNTRKWHSPLMIH